MYANADLQYASEEFHGQARQVAAERTTRPSVRQPLLRFLAWFDSGSTQPHMIKADQSRGTDILLIHGQVVTYPSCREETGADQFTK